MTDPLTPKERIAAAQELSVNPWEVEPATPPLPQRMRAAAETIEQINAMAGMGLNCSVSPVWLRREADRIDQEAIA